MTISNNNWKKPNDQQKKRSSLYVLNELEAEALEKSGVDISEYAIISEKNDQQNVGDI